MKNNYGIVRIKADFHQTLMTATDVLNNAIAYNSTSFDHREEAAEFSYNAARLLARKLQEAGISIVDVVVGGNGQGREPAIRALMDNGIIVQLIKDITPVPHNGAFPIKRERTRHSKKY